MVYILNGIFGIYIYTAALYVFYMCIYSFDMDADADVNFLNNVQWKKKHFNQKSILAVHSEHHYAFMYVFCTQFLPRGKVNGCGRLIYIKIEKCIV